MLVDQSKVDLAKMLSILTMTGKWLEAKRVTTKTAIRSQYQLTNKHLSNLIALGQEYIQVLITNGLWAGELIIGWEGDVVGPGGIWSRVQGMGSDHWGTRSQP